MCRVQGRCSAIAATILVLTLFLSCVTAKATTYVVGGSSGWSYNVQSWTKGKKFKAGDVLVFNYDPSLHNVAVVDSNGYKSCASTSSSQAYSSGKDKLKLSKGPNYFICSVPGHCDSGLKLAVNAS
ncbi:Phytocyanin domain containing protein [Trema orientale]|uniref:Basic blue protein n=1 Tax=Trema orientale TaxID=63057 RepID=A0A2P5CIC2_TREOI|nr:Phytocyanin domain containing protein [Trema orientale]